MCTEITTWCPCLRKAYVKFPWQIFHQLFYAAKSISKIVSDSICLNASCTLSLLVLMGTKSI